MGNEERELYEYKDMQTSGFSLTPIKCLFSVAEVFMKDLLKKEEEKKQKYGKPERKSRLPPFPSLPFKPHASKDCFVSSKLLNWVLRVEQI